MKKKLLFLLFLFLVFGIFMGIRYVYLSQSKQEGRIQILSSPNANVIIDGKAFGKTPFESVFPKGQYSIKLVADSIDASDSASWEGTVSVEADAGTFVSREIGINDITSSGVIMTVQPIDSKSAKKNTGQIEIQTQPDGSIVYLDDEEQGIAPLIAVDVESGDHELSVFSPGFFRRSQRIKVEPGYKILAHYKLAVDPSHKKVEKKPKGEIATDEASLNTTPTPSIAKQDQLSISINTTDTGWLRVRQEPTLSASEAAKVKPGDRFNVLEEKSGWYKIEYSKGLTGWISTQYTTKETP